MSELQSPHERIYKASLSGDVESITSMFSDDAVFMPPNDVTLYGRDEIGSWWKEYFQFFKIETYVETERETTVAGDQLFDRSAFSTTIVPNERGARIRDDIRSLTVWRRQADGTWKISHQMWN